MSQLTDIELNGTSFMLAAAGYERSAESPAPAKPGRFSLSTFVRGLGIIEDDQPGGRTPAGQGGGGWSGEAVHAVWDGSGLEPWPFVASYLDTALVDLPDPSLRAAGLIAGDHAYLHVGSRLYRSVPLSAGAWGNLTAVAALTPPRVVHDLAYFRDDILILSGPGNNILRYNTTTGAVGTWRAGEEGTTGIGYHGILLSARLAANNQERLDLGLTRFDGTAVTATRWLDSPIVRMGLFAGRMAIGTKSSLYLFEGQPEPGSVTPAVATTWRGDPQPLFTHGSWVDTAAGDFVFLLALGGKLYTWLAGHVVEYEPTLGREGWRPTGPRGRACFGACVAGAHLIVALQTADSQSEIWAFDGLGWWRILASSAPGPIWPVALSGAGGFDVLILNAGSNIYYLVRLTNHAGAPAYAPSGSWVSPLLTAGNADTTKSWRQLSAFFSWPEPPGNAGSGNSVTISLDYSVDAGESWTTAATSIVTISRTQQLVATLPEPPRSRLLQLRVRWDTVADWAPVLSRIVVDYAVLDTSPRRQRWQLKVTARDNNLRRDGSRLPGSGRGQIDGLWAAWRAQAPVTFRDVDFDDHPVTRQVRIVDIAEATPKAGDAGRWGDAVVSLTLAEV